MSERETVPASLHEVPDSGAPRSAGQMLRELRESAGVDPALLASAMKVSTQKLDALENDRLDLLPDVTFARGLASAICRAFGADPAPVLERMPVSAPGLRPPEQNINQPFRRIGDRPTPVTLATIGTADIRVQVPAIGTVVPRNQAVVRARVDGPLLEVAFTEGKPVAAGEVLARIDPEPFKAALAQARGQLARDAALLKNAQIDLDRYKGLLAQDSIAKQQVDTQAALVQQYKGTVQADEAAVRSAELQLSYTTIRAPIGGRAGLRGVLFLLRWFFQVICAHALGQCTQCVVEVWAAVFGQRYGMGG